MYFFTTLLSFTALLATVSGIKNNTQKYVLQTELKPGQRGKARYDGLYLETYHTGAGLSDAVVSKNRDGAAEGFLNGTNGQAGQIRYQNQIFDLGTDFAWSLVPEPNVVFYTSWQPVRINAGGGPSAPKSGSGFYLNETGLQWTSAPGQKPGGNGNQFGGWIVCNWWHENAIQLFFRMKYYNPTPLPCSCADVYLKPRYI